MNLSQLVDYVCTQVQMVGTDDRTACKMFLSKQYELIYNSYLWKDSLVMVNVTVDPADANNAEGVVLLPEVIDRVVAVRTADQSVRVRGLEDFYRIDFDKFNETGRPYEFSILSPIWFMWTGTSGLRFSSSDAADDAKVVRVTWWDSDGVRHIQTKTLNSATNPTVTRPGASVIEVTGAGMTAANGTYTYIGAATLGGVPRDYVFQQADDPNFYIFYSSTLPGWVLADYTGLPLIPYQTTTGLTEGWTANTNSPAPTVAYSSEQEITVESVFTPELDGDLTVGPILPLDGNSGEILAGETGSSRLQRIRLFNIPDVETTLKVLGKKKFVPLDFDQQEPEIKNLDNCLIAFACGAMWKRRRQMAKAMEEMKIGVALLGELAKLETIQASHNSRFIPDGGAGDVFFGPGRSGGLWI
jgi:hypothetical protein